MRVPASSPLTVRSSNLRGSTPTRVSILLGAGSGAACLFMSGPARWAGAMLLVLYLPGHAVRAALRFQPDDLLTSLATDVAVSVCSLIFAGLLLDITSSGIREWSLVSVLELINVIGVLVASLRTSVAERDARPADSVRPWRLTLPALIFSAFAVTAVLIAVASSVQSDRRTKTTQLSIQGLPGERAQVEVRNLEHSGERYHLSISTSDRSTFEADMWVAAGAQRRLEVSTAGRVPGGKLTAILYREGFAPPYRQVWLIPS